VGAGAAATAWPLPLGERALAATEKGSAAGRLASPIRLNSNENAYGPFPKALAAMREAITRVHRYPDAPKEKFVERVAALHAVTPKQVLMGCGSVEILKVCAAAFTGAGRKLLMASPTFESIGRFAETAGAEVLRVPLLSDFAHDLSTMLAKAGEAGLVYICNPNNPTASLTPRQDLEAFISRLPPSTHVLIDEAYHHFAVASPEYASFLDRPVANERVIVARTFSKVYGLAGMRLGYGISSPPTVQRMRPYGLNDNANVAVLNSALAALDDELSLRASVHRNSVDRAEFINQARARKLSAIPSHANFAMIDTGQKVGAVIEHFKKKGVLVGRPFPPLDSYLRVSFGLPAEMERFWRVWDQLPQARG
jgi:histidinol-phosphate aminotransferase